ncbi:DEAD/DEAH box helicase [Plectonema cf. radiosum LEGE 06105]|uniref:DEAD/DEAH box helicase n=1 Tax=Plectonema cf. radiosum LEGE 06105 TaxID=945769 RepID=A0A8J7F9D1_9CYAN|nr:DEAD/DEAH box helicase [Plectonema radiosum]MBE9214024.1 DEAD/DEAH box helicase [Plectonema cf. radiosum LEGE 06105]
MSDAYNRLAPFIQEYIYHNNWTELRPIQTAACEIIFETDAHLLIAAGTASGKTEAAFLPVLTHLYQKPANTIGTIYIGPIKALINDQFERLNDLLREADIPVYHWHGDVSQTRKKQLLKTPSGILQITPESLESLLINKHEELTRLFGDVRFVVIDEIHAFMGTERGYQILCQLERLANLTKNQPRRIGLSATLGDYSLAEDWLSSGTNKRVITPKIQAGKRQIKLALEHFYVPEKTNNSEITDYDEYIFNLSKSSKCLIFANNKSQTESIVASLRQIAATQNQPDIYHVHHGSISASLRQAAENAMREPDKPAVTAATLTLEVGVDIGYLQRVIQLESPDCIASFLQRLGRTGRRGEPADMRFVCSEKQPSLEASLPQQIPWQLLQSIAVIQLYLEEKWIEPIQPIKYPFSLLYHQTMSTLAAIKQISPTVLAHQVLNLSSFQHISSEDYKLLLRYLVSIDHIHKTDESKLIIGLAGEKIVNKFQFYAVFPETLEFHVKQDATDIGTIVMIPNVGSQFGLAGKTWEVLDVDFAKKTIFVKQVEGKAGIFWRGGRGTIHSKILQRMRRVLLEDIEYGYLQTNAKNRLQAARQLARDFELDKSNIFKLEKGQCCIFPWMGTIAYNTLQRLLNNFCRESLEIKSLGGINPYFMTLKLGKGKFEQLKIEILSLCEQRIINEHLVADAEAPEIQKYDKFIPHPLLRKAFASDYLNIEEVKQQVELW